MAVQVLFKRRARHFLLGIVTCGILPLQCATLERLTLDDYDSQIDGDRAGEGHRVLRQRLAAR